MLKTALITGASSGIGKEFAKIHSQSGGNIVIVARSKDKLESLKFEIESKYSNLVHVLVKDLSKPNASEELYNEVKELDINIDYLINNAGFGIYGMFNDSDLNAQKDMLNLNVIALMNLTHLFVQDMIKRGTGKVLNVSSTAAFQPLPIMSTYAASKTFVLHFSEAINNELKDKGVSVTALCPGVTESEFHEVAHNTESKLIKESKMASSYEVARCGYDAMLEGKSFVIHGTSNYLKALSTRFASRDSVIKVSRKIME